MDVVMVYITFGSIKEAKMVGTQLVQSRLAACVNIKEHVTSIYHWEDQLHEDEEVIMIAKTTPQRFNDLKEKVLSLHSYDCPCIVSFPVTSGHSEFLSWVVSEVA